MYFKANYGYWAPLGAFKSTEFHWDYSYRIAPRHLIFREPTLLRAAARFSVTSSLAVKPRRLRAWRFHGRLRVRKRSSRIYVLFFLAVASFAACTTVSAASPSPPADSSATPQQYIFGGFVCFSCFYILYQIRSGSIAYPD